MKRLHLVLMALFLVINGSAFGQTVLNDASITAGQTVVLSAETEYLLDGFVYVEDGAVLIIEPGTVIKARNTPTTGDNASALIVARGGYLHAEGTAHEPIIFTSEDDDLTDPSDLTFEDRGLWGGLIILGRATTNRGIDGQIEGIPSTESRSAYGGNNDHDDSGLLRYVSIRHGGAELAPGDEINGLTLGAVGDQTLIEHVEIYANLDDGVEWFGGTVNTRYLAAAFCGDDAFDYDEGWRGHNQYWFALQGTDFAGRIGEHDGGTVQEEAQPYAQPYIYNATYIGPGVTAFPQGDGNAAIILRDNAGGHYANSIITEYNGANGGVAILVEDASNVQDSRARLEAGDLSFDNNLWYGFGAGNTLEQIVTQEFVRNHVAAHHNSVEDPMLRRISRTADGNLDPRPTLGSPANSGARVPVSPWFHATSFRGAFDPDQENWLAGWSALAQEGHLADSGEGDRAINHVTALNGNFTTQVTLNNLSATAQSVTLHPFALDGTALTAVTLEVPAHTLWHRASNAADLFGDAAVSHFGVTGSDAVGVTVGYKAATGTGATAHVNANQVVGRAFEVYPGESAIVFDGAAMVNHGSAAATVEAWYLDAAGAVLSQTSINSALAPNAKSLFVFNAPANTARVRITSSEPVGTVFLRGTQAGLGANILFEVVPAIVVP